MLTLITCAAGALLAVTLPRWLPGAIVRLRAWIFFRINGDTGVSVPGTAVDAARFKWLYGHPAANGRSRGAALSDLFWYWLAPGPELHQEHLEPGARYEEVAAATRRILGCSPRAAATLVHYCFGRALAHAPIQRARFVRLRDWMMPVWAEFYYELVFGERCPAAARRLIVDNANDVVTALKCCGLRHMRKRERLTAFLRGKIAAGMLPHALPACLAPHEQALYLQGVFFNTAVVQMSEASAHVLLALAQHVEVQNAVRAAGTDERPLDRVITETLRLYPLFGISHRIASADIVVDGQTTLHKGTVLCFSHPDFHRAGYSAPERFDPDRWEHLATRDANYIPFGVPANRPCPAQAIALATLRVVVREVLARFSLSSSASHTRSLPHRGPCLIVPHERPVDPALRTAALAFMRFRDSWEDVYRSLLQLCLGTYMVWEARRLRLCEHYFTSGTDR